MTVFFSEDVAAPGSVLEKTIHNALKRSRVLLVVCNEGTLLDPRWVQTEVEYFRKNNPNYPVVPLSINCAVQNAFAQSLNLKWLCNNNTIWIDETLTSDTASRVSPVVLQRALLSCTSVRVSKRWSLLKSVVITLLASTSLAATWAAILAESRRARAQELLADERTDSARQRLLLGDWDTAGALLVSIYDEHRASDAQRLMLAAALRPLEWIKNQFQNDSTPASSANFSIDNQRVALAHSSNVVYVHEVSDGRLVAKFSLQKERIYQVILNATGDRLVTVELQSEIDASPDADYTLSHSIITTLWDINSNKKLQTWEQSVESDDLPSEREPWVTRNSPGTTFRLRGIPENGADRPTEYAFVSGQPVTTSEAKSPSIKLNLGSTVALSAIHEGSSSLVANSDDGSVIVSIGRGGTTALVDAGRLRPPWKLEVPMSVVQASFTSDGNGLVALGQSGRLISISTNTGQVTSDITAEPDSRGHALSSNGARAIVFKSRALFLVDAVTGKEIRKLPPDTVDARFSGNSKYLASWTSGGSEARITLSVRSAGDGKRIYTTELIGDEFSSFAISNSGDRWTAKSRSHQQLGSSGVADDVLAPHNSETTLTEFLGDKNVSVSGLEDGSLAFDTSRSGIPAHKGEVTALTQSNDGKQIVSASSDGEMAVWDVVLRRPILKLRGHEGKVNSVQFAGNSNLLVSASEDGTARLWSLQSGREVLRWRPSNDPVRSASISPDGTHVLTGTTKALHLWVLARENRSASALSSVTRERLQTCDVDHGPTRWRAPEVGHTRGPCGQISR